LFTGSTGDGLPGTIVVRVGNNRPDLGTNPICNRYTGPLEEGQPLFLPCNPPMPGAFVSVHLEVATPTDIPVQLSLCEAFVYTDQVYVLKKLLRNNYNLSWNEERDFPSDSDSYSYNNN